jgi:RES domain-containing protein
LRFRGACFRAHDPRWSFKPLSGDGAAVYGGRFNAKGTPALYLALTPIGAVREINQGFAHKIDPCVLCSYDIDCDDIVDLRLATELARLGQADLACAWMLDVSAGREPATWRVARRLRDEGAAGTIVPSFANGALATEHNLVLWSWGADRPHKVTVHDPSGRLPKNQLSWD